MRICAIALLLMFQSIPSPAAEPAPVDFAHEVLPILETHCAECHTDGTYKGSLSMDTRAMLLDSEVVVPGKPGESELITRVATDDIFTQMPPDGEGERLSEAEVAVLRRWIEADLPWADGFTFRTEEEQLPLALQEVQIPEATAASGEHPIDRLLAAYAAEKEVELAPPADDATFLRRLHLDMIGLLPSERELTAFLRDTSPDKRDRAVEEIFQRDRDYAAHWMTFWNDLLRNDYVGTGYIDGGRKQITQWLHTALRENMPYDEFVRQLIAPGEASEGFAKGIVWRGKINASQVPPLQFSQNVGQVFLGINLKCASCHDSFISDWKLADAYGLAAVVSEKPLELHRCDVPQGVMAEPKFLFPQIGAIDPNAPVEQRQQQLAKLMTDPDNGRLPRTIVNRLWQRLMGQGLVEPVDSMASPAWSPELLEYLSNYLVEHDYDIQKLLKHIAKSKAYQREAVEMEVAPESGEFIFRGPLVKRMTAEQYLDALWTLTDTGPEKPNAGLPMAMLSNGVTGPDVRAVFVTAGPLMRSLGRPNREQVVTTRPDELTTLQALNLSNGPELATLLAEGAEHLALKYRRAVEAPRPGVKPKDQGTGEPRTSQAAGALVEDVFRQALSRKPTDAERQLALELLGDPMTGKGIADLLWAVVLLPEFQHVR